MIHLGVKVPLTLHTVQSFNATAPTNRRLEANLAQMNSSVTSMLIISIMLELQSTHSILVNRRDKEQTYGRDRNVNTLDPVLSVQTF